MGFGRGKVILLGEHAVVHGYPAIALGIERGASAEARVAERDRLLVPAWDIDLAPDPKSEDPLARAFAVLLAQYEDRAPLELRVQVELPAGAGLGCSAAVGVAVLDAIDEALGIERSRQAHADQYLEREKVFKGKPTGNDNNMSALGGVALYRKGQGLVKLQPRRPLQLVVGYSGEPGSTKAMVASVERQLRADPARMRRDFEAVEILVRNARAAIEAGDHRALGQLLDLNHSLLSGWMLCTTKLDAMCRAAREAGALGAKLTGGGGGGCMFALAADEESAKRIAEALGDDAFIAEVGT